MIGSIRLHFDFLLSAVFPFGADKAITVAYIEKLTAMQPAEKPEIIVLHKQSSSMWPVVSVDAVGIREYQRARFGDHKLVGVVSDNIFYLVSPRDIVIVKPRDLDDRTCFVVFS